jgi:hypothetical protein
VEVVSKQAPEAVDPRGSQAARGRNQGVRVAAACGRACQETLFKELQSPGVLRAAGQAGPERLATALALHIDADSELKGSEGKAGRRGAEACETQPDLADGNGPHALASRFLKGVEIRGVRVVEVREAAAK